MGLNYKSRDFMKALAHQFGGFIKKEMFCKFGYFLFTDTVKEYITQDWNSKNSAIVFIKYTNKIRISKQTYTFSHRVYYILGKEKKLLVLFIAHVLYFLLMFSSPYARDKPQFHSGTSSFLLILSRSLNHSQLFQSPYPQWNTQKYEHRTSDNTFVTEQRD